MNQATISDAITPEGAPDAEQEKLRSALRKTFLNEIDQALERSDVGDGPKALILLRLCQFTQVLAPEIFEEYWPRLKSLERAIPGDERETYEGLKASVEPPPEKKVGKFTRGILDEVEAAQQAASADPEDARNRLLQSEGKLRKRRWPFGKRPAWIALIQAWSELDRMEALRLTGRVPRGVQRNLIARMNDGSPLTEEEWETAHKQGGKSRSMVPVIEDLLDRENQVLQLPQELATAVGSHLRDEIYPRFLPDDEKGELNTEQKTALSRYLTLARCMAQRAPEAAIGLMRMLILQTAEADRFDGTWTERFTLLRLLIAAWANSEEMRAGAPAFFKNELPGHVRDFALAQWFGSLGDSEDEIREMLGELSAVCAESSDAMAWFLIALVKREAGETAFKLASETDALGTHLGRVRRALVCEDLQTAAKILRPEDFEDDPVGRFLLLPSVEEKVRFLRSETGNGSRSLPSYLWRQPSFLSVLDSLSRGSEATSALGESDLQRLFRKDEELDNQFADYLRLHGYGSHGYEDVDPHLLATLAAWDDEHPEEVKSLLSAMWNVFRPDESLLMIDFARDTIFTRCRNLFAAHPESLKQLFLDWIKQKLVDDSVQQQTGDMIRTLQLPEKALFLWSLMAAQNIAEVSAKRCDEVLVLGLANYQVENDLVKVAASAYASDKGLSALELPVKLQGRSRIEAWQAGVVEASKRHMLLALALS